MLAVGNPRLRVTHDFLGPLAMRIGARRLFAYDDGEVKVWELDRGTLVARIDLKIGTRQTRTVPVVVSVDGTWLATEVETKVVLSRAPFLSMTATGVLMSPMMFVSDELIGALVDMRAMFLAPPHRVTTAPESDVSVDTSLGLCMTVSQFGDSAFAVMYGGLLRWDRGTGTVKVVTRAPSKWHSAEIALAAPVALVTDQNRLYRLDLESGAAEALPTPAGSRSTISPSGKRAAFVDGGIDVVDLPGTRLAKISPKGAVTVAAFAETDDDLAFEVDGQIEVHNLHTGRKEFGAPSRFLQWLGPGRALIERGGARRQLDVATYALSPTDATSTFKPAELIIERRQGDCPLTFQAGARTLWFVPTTSDDWTASDPCWVAAGPHVVAASAERVTIFNTATGKVKGTFDVPATPEPVDDDTFRAQFWSVQISPDGKLLALWWRRADMWPPPSPPDPSPFGHDYGPQEPECEDDERQGNCLKEYFAEVWSIDGKRPVRRWRHRPDTEEWGWRRWAYSKEPSGQIAFTPDSRHVLFGFRDGEIWIRSVNSEKPIRIERLHQDPITRIEISPDGRYVFSEDEGGEQRIWPLSPP